MKQPKDNGNNENKEPGKFSKYQTPRNYTFIIVLVLFIFVMYQMYKLGGPKVENITFSDFWEKVQAHEISQVSLSDRNVNIVSIDGRAYTTYLPDDTNDLIWRLTDAGVKINAEKPSRWIEIIGAWLPFLIFIGLWFFMMRGMRGGAGQAFSFGKSRAKLADGAKSKITFQDVAGVDEAKEELEEIVEYLKDPDKFQKLGGRIPRGVLLVGRPGTGKTLLAKAVAGEAKVPFYSISGSDFVEMFVGVGASRVRDMFVEAKKNAPCIAFIDEIDAVGRSRGAGLGGGHDEREQTLNQLLVEMDGFDQNDSVIIIAATNRPDVLDMALLRPGRFDRQVMVDLPDIKGREEILKVHTRKLPIAANTSLAIIARGTPGFSGADLANLVNEAALLAARKNKKEVEMVDIEEAKDKVTMGKARKSRVITEEDKLNTAYHEVGHVLCSIFQEKAEPVHKVTIIPRGFSGGATHFLQTEKTTYARDYLLHSLVGLYGGRCAEEIIFGQESVTTGASNDIERATDIARQMVCNWGMSTRIGPIVVSKKESQVFLGKDLGSMEHVSEETARIIDEEIHKILDEAYSIGMEILAKRKDLLIKMSLELVERETLTSEEIYEITLANIEDDEKIFVMKKYDKVKEMSLDTSKDFMVADEVPETEEPSEEEQEISEKEANEDKTTLE
ncbi:MAG: ATP-dependent zinc metalloprotease FtsH [Candidatus Cloacimonetes bacterium]|nr:ATP-dependent zinc metalloprotease FtsH [Candidatus Cloacimonadota bacterium]